MDYTVDRDKAGFYGRDQAEEIVRQANMFGHKNEEIRELELAA